MTNHDRDEAVQALNIALAYTGPSPARERMLQDAAALARRVLLARDRDAGRTGEQMNAVHFECYQVGPDGRERRVYVSDWLPPGTLIPNRPTSGTEAWD